MFITMFYIFAWGIWPDYALIMTHMHSSFYFIDFQVFAIFLDDFLMWKVILLSWRACLQVHVYSLLVLCKIKSNESKLLIFVSQIFAKNVCRYTLDVFWAITTSMQKFNLNFWTLQQKFSNQYITKMCWELVSTLFVIIFNIGRLLLTRWSVCDIYQVRKADQHFDCGIQLWLLSDVEHRNPFSCVRLC